MAQTLRPQCSLLIQMAKQGPFEKFCPVAGGLDSERTSVSTFQKRNDQAIDCTWSQGMASTRRRLSKTRSEPRKLLTHLAGRFERGANQMFCMFNDLALSPTRCSYYAHFSDDWAGTWCVRTTAATCPSGKCKGFWVLGTVRPPSSPRPALHTGADIPRRPAAAHGEEHQAGHAVHQSESGHPPQPLRVPGEPGSARAQLGPCPASGVLTRRLGVWSSLTWASPSSVHPTQGQPPALRDGVPPPSRQPGEVHV